MTLSLAQTKVTLVATSQGAVLVNCRFTAAEGFDPSISPPSCGILCDVFKIFKMASQSGCSLV